MRPKIFVDKVDRFSRKSQSNFEEIGHVKITNDGCMEKFNSRSDHSGPFNTQLTQSKFSFAILCLSFMLFDYSSVCALSEADLMSALVSQSNSMVSVGSVDSPTSYLSSSGVILGLRSNLSCYVCMSVQDMRCRYINETNRHLHNGEQVTILPRSERSIHGERANEVFDPEADLSGDTSSEIGPLGPGSEITENMHIFGKECTGTERYCQVVSLGVSPQDSQSNEYNFFGLIRGCADTCSPGCFIIGNGERTKLNFCTSCCTGNYCNVQNSAPLGGRHSLPSLLAVIPISGLITILTVIATFRQL